MTEHPDDTSVEPFIKAVDYWVANQPIFWGAIAGAYVLLLDFLVQTFVYTIAIENLQFSPIAIGIAIVAVCIGIGGQFFFPLNADIEVYPKKTLVRLVFYGLSHILLMAIFVAVAIVDIYLVFRAFTYQYLLIIRPAFLIFIILISLVAGIVGGISLGVERLQRILCKECRKVGYRDALIIELQESQSI